MKENKNKLLQQRNDIQQKRADQLDLATKALGNGDTVGYDAAMAQVKTYNTDLERINGLMSECEKAFTGEDFRDSGEAETRVNKSGIALVNKIRGTEQYMEAFAKAMRAGISPEKGMGMEGLKPLYEAEAAMKALTCSSSATTSSRSVLTSWIWLPRPSAMATPSAMMPPWRRLRPTTPIWNGSTV